ncbi:MAG: PLP-dependent aminotransferase family protein [Flavobacteriaceae bacterium]|jgi:2-aminoadipate transaminase|nr:PLP-dependent aminotransferase family protein [Flavobacteriaceae bacterium]
MNNLFSEKMKVVKPSAIDELLALGADKSIISFGGGYPDASLFPKNKLIKVFSEIINDPSGASMQYAPSDGLPKLREQIANLMTLDGTPCDAKDVLILHGSQQGFDLVSKMFIDPGDVLITEDPTFLGALIAFNLNQPNYKAVPIDDDGMRTDLLKKVLEENPKTKMIYTIPDFQNPTGVTLSLTRRKQLINLANLHDVVILEDTPYRHIRFEGESLPTLKSMDTQNRVIHLGSFSKILVPGLRIGWAVAEANLIKKMGLLKVAADTQTSTLNMAATSMFLERYDLNAHINKLKEAYLTKKELMLEQIKKHFPENIKITNPSGGLFTWVTFDEKFDTTKFMKEIALPEAKVAYVPGGSFFPVKEQKNHARINFSSQSEDLIQKGITSLGQSLRNYEKRNKVR